MRFYFWGFRFEVKEADLHCSDRSNLPDRAALDPETAFLAARLSAASTASTLMFLFFIDRHPTFRRARTCQHIQAPGKSTPNDMLGDRMATCQNPPPHAFDRSLDGRQTQVDQRNPITLSFPRWNTSRIKRGRQRRFHHELKLLKYKLFNLLQDPPPGSDIRSPDPRAIFQELPRHLVDVDLHQAFPSGREILVCKTGLSCTVGSGE